MFALPSDRCTAVFLRTTESLETPVKHAGLGQLRFNPKAPSALLAFRVIALLHLSKPGPEVFLATAVNQALEDIDTGWPANKKLNPAWIAHHVWLALFRGPDLTRVRTYGAREHSLSIQSCQFPEPPIHPTRKVLPIVRNHRNAEFRTDPEADLGDAQRWGSSFRKNLVSFEGNLP